MADAAPPVAPQLLDRDRELEQLAERIGAAAAGDGSVVVLEGVAGIGKSALLACATRRAADSGMRVLRARGGELEQGISYGVVRQLFDAPLTAEGRDERARMLTGAAGLALPALSIGAASAGLAGEPGSVLHGLYWLTANLAAEQPLLLAIDDAQWADGASVAFLSYLTRRIEGHALLVVVATRSDEGVAEQLPAAAQPDLVACVLRPCALSLASAVTIVGAVLGPCAPEFAKACHTASGGNPFLLRELLRSLHEDGVAPDSESCPRIAQIAPPAISRATLARVRRLGDAATRLASAIAVLGISAQARHAAELARLDLETAADAAGALARASILRDARPLEFIHPLVHTTIYQQIPAAERAVSHKRAARILARDAAGPEDVAAHLVEAESAGDPDVVGSLRVAAAGARARGAPQAAVAYLVRALREPPPADDRASVLYELGSAELTVGDPQASEHLRAALEGDLDADLRLAAALDFVSTLVYSDHVDEGLRLLDALIDEFAAEGDVDAAMQVEGILVCTGQISPVTFEVMRDRLARYTGRLRGESPGGRLLLAAMAFDAVHLPVPAAHAADLAEQALDDGRLLYEQYAHAANFALATLALLAADRLERAERMATLALEHARDRGSVIGFAGASALRSQVLLRRGRVADAEAEARSGLEAAGQVWPLGRPMLLGCVLEAMLERADLADCEAFLVEQGIDGETALGSIAPRLLFSRGHVRLAAGHAASALRDFEQRGSEPHGLPVRASAALAHMQLGEHERARELSDEALERARTWGAPGTLSFALRTSGLVVGGEEGLELLRAAAAAAEHSPARYEHARSLTEYGAALRRNRRRSEARETLRAALELADRCGARRTAARAHEELLATGARPRRIARSGVDALTPSERRVARLASGGRTNREIAQQLFVTVRTVETHLGHAYEKLDLDGRAELAAVLDAADEPR